MGVLNELQHVISFSTAKKSKIASYVENLRNLTAVITFVTGAKWNNVPVTAGTSVYTQRRITDDPAGIYFEQQLKCSVPVKEIDFPNELNEITNEPVYCRLGLADGNAVIVSLVKLAYDFDSGNSEVVITFKRKNLDGALLLVE